MPLVDCSAGGRGFRGLSTYFPMKEKVFPVSRFSQVCTAGSRMSAGASVSSPWGLGCPASPSEFTGRCPVLDCSAPSGLDGSIIVMGFPRVRSSSGSDFFSNTSIEIGRGGSIA